MRVLLDTHLLLWALSSPEKLSKRARQRIKIAKAVVTHTVALKYVTSNIMHRYPRLQHVEGERKANRGVWDEGRKRVGHIDRSQPFAVSALIHCSSGPVSV